MSGVSLHDEYLSPVNDQAIKIDFLRNDFSYSFRTPLCRRGRELWGTKKPVGEFFNKLPWFSSCIERVQGYLLFSADGKSETSTLTSAYTPFRSLLVDPAALYSLSLPLSLSPLPHNYQTTLSLTSSDAIFTRRPVINNARNGIGKARSRMAVQITKKKGRRKNSKWSRADTSSRIGPPPDTFNVATRHPSLRPFVTVQTSSRPRGWPILSPFVAFHGIGARKSRVTGHAGSIMHGGLTEPRIAFFQHCEREGDASEDFTIFPYFSIVQLFSRKEIHLFGISRRV